MHSPNFSLYGFGPGHPFDPERFDRFPEYLKEKGAGERFEIIGVEKADWEIIESVHEPEYLERLRTLAKIGGMVSPDTPVSSSLIEGARYMVSAAVKGMDIAMENGWNVITMGGFHHAGPDYGEGFCIINDVAIAAKHALSMGKKVLILDIDAHQGNGTMDIFWEEPDVLFISIHQDPRTIYPGRGFIRDIGGGDGKGYTVNIPMPRFSGDRQYALAFEEIIVPISEQFGADVVITNGGSDPHYDDPLTDLGITLKGLNYMGRMARRISKGRPMLNMLVSGYGRMTMPGWYALAAGFSGMEWDEDDHWDRPSWARDERMDDLTKAITDAIKKELKDYWSF